MRDTLTASVRSLMRRHRLGLCRARFTRDWFLYGSQRTAAVHLICYGIWRGWCCE